MGSAQQGRKGMRAAACVAERQAGATLQPCAQALLGRNAHRSPRAYSPRRR